MKNKQLIIYIVLIVLAVVVNMAGINGRFFTDDPGLYASISKNLLYKHSLWNLYSYNRDWLDKPHFPFWMAMLSFKLFGIHTWSYRLPALLFFFLGAVYTFLFTRRYYGYEIGLIAVLILLTALHTVISNSDVRAEPYLMGLVIASIYHISRLDERFSLKDLLFAALFTAFALMTKGLFVLLAIYGALAGQLIFKNRFKDAFRFKWLALFFLTLLFTLPELYALYTQFDLHPEKIVFSRQHVSGIQWFLWDSQFGRFVNNGPITRKSGDVFFYIHTLLWAFAPWCLVFYFSIIQKVRQIIQHQPLVEYYSLSGGLLLLLLFSLSRFQLPFYTNAIFPLFAISTASYCSNDLSQRQNTIRLFGQWIYIAVLPVAIFVITWFMKPENLSLLVLETVVAGLLSFLIYRSSNKKPIKIFLINCTVGLFVSFYFNSIIFPEIGHYVGQIKAAQYINQPALKSYRVYSLNMENNIFQFYTDKPIQYLPIEKFNQTESKHPALFYANSAILTYLKQHHESFSTLKAFQNYPQENVLPAFINKATRSKVLDSVYLITNLR